MTRLFFQQSAPTLESLLVGQFQSKVADQPKEAEVTLLDWMHRYRALLEKGRVFSLDDHRYLEAIYTETAKEVVVCKASQLGISEWLISYAMHACDQRNCTVLYLFPNDRLVSDFSAARIGPAIEASPYLASIVVDASDKEGKRGADRITLKRIRDRFLYLRGGTVKTDGKAPQLKSVPGDVLIIDEFDETDPRAISIGRKRLGHSTVAEVRLVSTPTYPGLGIHAEYMASDQRRWMVRCPHCNRWQTMDKRNVIIESDTLGRPTAWYGMDAGTAYAACLRCKKPLDRAAKGEWVAAYEGRTVHGYQINKLALPTVNVLELVDNLQETDETKRTEADNQDWGEPHIPRGGSLTEAQLDACRRDYGHAPDGSTCYMGVDVGSMLNVVVRARLSGGERRQLYAGEVSTFEEVGRLIRLYNPRTVVIDALPETKKARELQEEFSRGKVWLAYYHTLKQGSKKDSPINWDDKEMIGNLDRTRTLDETTARFVEGTNTLPAYARDIVHYYDQLTASVRVLRKDANDVEVAVYVHTADDHYFHAENYCTAASLCPYGGWARGG